MSLSTCHRGRHHRAFLARRPPPGLQSPGCAPLRQGDHRRSGASHRSPQLGSTPAVADRTRLAEESWAGSGASPTAMRATSWRAVAEHQGRFHQGARQPVPRHLPDGHGTGGTRTSHQRQVRRRRCVPRRTPVRKRIITADSRAHQPAAQDGADRRGLPAPQRPTCRTLGARAPGGCPRPVSRRAARRPRYVLREGGNDPNRHHGGDRMRDPGGWRPRPAAASRRPARQAKRSRGGRR